MVLNNVIVDVTTSRCSFLLSQTRGKVSASFTNVSSLVVAAFVLYTGPCLSSSLSLSTTIRTLMRRAQLVCDSRDYKTRLTTENVFSKNNYNMDFVNNYNIITFIYTAQIQLYSFQMRLTIKNLKIYLTIKDLKIYHKKKKKTEHSQ